MPVKTKFETRQIGIKALRDECRKQLTYPYAFAFDAWENKSRLTDIFLFIPCNPGGGRNASMHSFLICGGPQEHFKDQAAVLHFVEEQFDCPRFLVLRSPEHGH